MLLYFMMRWDKKTEKIRRRKERKKERKEERGVAVQVKSVHGNVVNLML